jgi:hypothetical protein
VVAAAAPEGDARGSGVRAGGCGRDFRLRRPGCRSYGVRAGLDEKIGNVSRPSGLSLDMLHACRAFLLVLGFLSLQLSLVSGGDRCPVVNLFAGSASLTGTASMSGMDMGGMAMAGMDMSSADHAAEGVPGPGTGHDEPPCDTHGERTGCDSMTVCTFAAVTTARPPQIRPPVPMVHALQLVVRMPVTEASAPDHPPPKPMS